jgi:Ino eighty subunit 2
VSSIRDGEVVLRVAAPKGKEEWISLEPTEFKAVDEEEGKGKKGVGVARCDVPGCQERRKYRSTRKLEVGGCSLEHLRAVNDGLAAEDS